jgi:hypothetical protein
MDEYFSEVENKVAEMTKDQAEARLEELRPLCGEPISLAGGQTPPAVDIRLVHEYQCIQRRLALLT